MVKLKVFFLNNFKGFYYSGEEIEGAVQVKLSSAGKLTFIRVIYRGSARVHFAQGEDSYTSSTKYFKTIETIWHAGDKHEKVPKGIHLYKFEFRLPHDLPSSLKSLHGEIKYTIKARLAQPWRIDSTLKETFSVRSDISGVKRLLSWSVPPRNDITKTYTAFCCHTTGSISASVKLNKKCFTPGETVRVCASIHNESNRNVKYSEVKVKKTISFHAGGKEQLLKETLACEKKGKVKSDESVMGLHYAVQIPTGESSIANQHCSIINVTYTVKLIVHLSGCAKNVKVPVEILVGNSPGVDVQNSDEECLSCSNTDALSAPVEYLHTTDMYKELYGGLYGIENAFFGGY